MTRKIIYLCLLTAIGFSTRAQTTTDYLVLHTGDTLYGKVEHVKESFASSTYHKKIRLTNTSGKTSKHNRKDVHSFKVGSKMYRGFWLTEVKQRFGKVSTHYSITPNQGELHFLYVLGEGKLNHYHMEWWEQGEASVDWMDLFLKEGDSYLISPAQGVLGLKRKVLHTYFSDCPALQNLIANRQIRKVGRVADYYNSNCE